MIPLPAAYRSVDSARYAPIIDSAGFPCFQLGSDQDLLHSDSSLTLLRISDNTHSRGIFFEIKPQPPQPLCGCKYVISVQTVRDGKQMILFFSWIVSDKEVRMI